MKYSPQRGVGAGHFSVASKTFVCTKQVQMSHCPSTQCGQRMQRASRMSRTYTDRHGLKDLVREVLNVDLSKQQQSSDWGAQSLSEAQLAYAASDVLHLHALRDKLNVMLAREGRTDLAQSCFDFLPTRARLDLDGWEAEDIFAHS